MAADQRRKKLSNTSIVGHSSREQHRAKKKILEPFQTAFDFSPHISLELDGSQKRVVAKREQIGLSKRDLAPYSSSVPDCHNILADVITLPKECFYAENLEDVLSYEVWENFLSDNEKKFLSQFLPKGLDSDEVVELLLSGSNLSFGNPAREWVMLLASGDLHPDAIIFRKQSLMASRREYCSELQDYHTSMIKNLVQLKEIWESCQDPSMFLPVISRLVSMSAIMNRKDLNKSLLHKTKSVMGKRTFEPTSEYKLHCPDHILGGTSESLSPMEDEKACSTDDQVVTDRMGRELRTRKGLIVGNAKRALADIGDNHKVTVRRKKVKKLSKCNSVADGAKYMSYIKITKKQLELLKRPLKANQSDSDNHVLGNLDNYNIQPCAIFEEEEQKKLHDQWLRVVSIAPQAFTDWTMRQGQKKQFAQTLYQDLKEIRKQVLQNHETPHRIAEEQNPCAGTDNTSKMNDEVCVASLAETRNTSLHEPVDGNDMDEVDSVEDHNIPIADQVPSCHEDNMMDMVPQNNDCSNEVESSYQHSMPDFSGSSSSALLTIGATDLSSVRNNWQTAKLPLPSHQTIAHGYTTEANDLPLGHLQSNLAHHSQFVESNLQENGTEPGMLHRPVMERTFGAYQNHGDRSQLLLQSIFNNPELLSYKPEQKQLISHFQQSPNVMMGNAGLPLPIEYQEPLQHPLLFPPRQKRDEEFYMHQGLRNNIHDIDTGNGPTRFTVTGQEHPQPLNLKDWHANSVNMTAPLQSLSHGGELINPSWFPVPQQVIGGWSNTSNAACNPNQGMRNQLNNNDETLFSVLSQCNELHSGASYDHSVSSNQIMAPGGFGVLGGGIRRNNNMVPQSALPQEYMGGREAPPPPPQLLSNGIGWVSIPRQNSGLHDSTGKPFLTSWNQ